MHILGGDLANVARRRDRSQQVNLAPGEDLVTFINHFNGVWVEATRRLSPRVLIDLLAFSGPQLFNYFGTLDLAALGSAVGWTGQKQSPVWLYVAREHTERWLHQQHIRDAVGKPGYTDRRFMAPVLATFVHALPYTLRDAAAIPGTALHLHIDGESGGDWAIVRKQDGWKLYMGTPEQAAAYIAMDEGVAWRLLTKGLTPAQGEEASSFSGDISLGRRVLDAVAIIA